MRPIFLIALLVFFTGCSTVTSRQPVGSQPCPIDDAKLWNGHWMVVSDSPAQPLVIQVVDAPAGLVRVTYIQAPSSPSTADPAGAATYPTVSSFLVQLRKEGDVVVGNLYAVEEFALAGKTSKVESQDEFFWFLLTVGDKGPAVAILPNAERLGELVEAKELRGTKKDGNVTLEGLTPDEFARLIADAKAFHYTKPLTIMRAVSE